MNKKLGTMKKNCLAIAAAGLLAAPMVSNAVPVSFGALSSDDDGSTTIITDSLNNYEWLRWDATVDFTYAQTLAAISTGGLFEGWQVARNAEAQMFTNALLLGLDNFCTVTDQSSCNEVLPNDLTGLLGDSGSGVTNRTRFVSDYEGEELAGFIDYVHEGNFGSLYKSNIGAPVSSVGESGGNVGWLLYRTEAGSVPPLAGVPEPATFALFGLGLAEIGVMCRRRRT